MKHSKLTLCIQELPGRNIEIYLFDQYSPRKFGIYQRYSPDNHEEFNKLVGDALYAFINEMMKNTPEEK